ncbi:nicotinic acid mononucleotide adenyltransferase [Aurantibacter crassamenti]|uniref:toxin-antitoxin system YwqK family antitoxin n=1 Tax=Aurantibacter crassamenti TaxID=1837375 RepID=UPI00193AB3BE|nr:nicotinic acid mononucleotide adenyltransferase [Aurantibacter crassamenti]MBM1105420.1 nicotinic acid mononucleotide adenyltransferase [Aurantibacter crassamenti]
MKKILLILAIVLVSSSAFSQKAKEMKLNNETNLIEATYYHENGEISQQGTFNLDKKLHGDWISYNDKGDKVSQGAYVNGVKTGKWQFWNDGSMKEVEFSDNAIASVINKENSARVSKN